MKFFFWFFVLLIAVIVALFAVANRDSVSLGLWPFSFVVQTPLYLAILLSLLIGFLAGAVAGWAGGASNRGESRRRRRRIAALERELAATQAQLPQSEPAPGTALAVRR
jgi:uncharacterized integral membrane protein